MPRIEVILTDPAVLIAVVMVVIGFVLALCRLPRDRIPRRYTVGALWFTCFGVLAVSAMRRQGEVLAGADAFSQEHPVGVPIKGVVRYVTQDLAYRHEASMWVLLAAALAFAAIYKLARVGSNESL